MAAPGPHVRLVTRAANIDVIALPLAVTPVVVPGGVVLPFDSVEARDDALAVLRRNDALLRRVLGDPFVQVLPGS